MVVTCEWGSAVSGVSCEWGHCEWGLAALLSTADPALCLGLGGWQAGLGRPDRDTDLWCSSKLAQPRAAEQPLHVSNA